MPSLLTPPSDAQARSGGSATGFERPLALRRRADLIAMPQVFSGARLWAVKDPVTLRYFHLQDEEYWIFERLDGRASLAEIQAQFERHFAPRRLRLGQLQAFLGMLHQEGLILADAPGQADELLKRRSQLKRQKVLATLSNVLAIRFRGIDPQRALDGILARFGWLICRWSLVACVGVVLTAAALVIANFDAMLARVPDFDSFLTPATAIWLVVALAVTKILHELGHALSCRYLGAECHELGLMFLVFTPCLYCNVSDAWMIESKWRRAAIGVAGVGVELVLASSATILWWLSEPGLFNTLCFHVMLVCSASTLLFNGNPLMRYDGYYVLADLVEVPNLSQAATATIRDVLGDWFLGIPAPSDDNYSPAKRLFLGFYALLSIAYRAFITVSILWFLNRLLKPYHLEFLVVVLALLVLAGMTAIPLWRAARYLQYASWSRQMNSRRAVASGLILAVVLLAVLLAPLPNRITAPAVLEAENVRRIYVPVAGTIVEGTEIGAAIQEGEPVAVLTNRELELEVAKLRGERDEQKLRLQNLKHRQTHDSEAAAQIPTAQESLADLEERLARRLEDQQRLVVSAPTSGTVLPGQNRPRTFDGKDLPAWSGLPLDSANRGCFLETGTLLCQIGDPNAFEATVMLDQGDIEFVWAGQEVQIQLDQNPGKVLSGTIREIAEIDLKITPAELLPAGTLPTRPDDAGVYRPVGTVYQARVALLRADLPLVIGEAGRAKVHAAPLSLARRLARYLSHTFRFEL